MSNLIDKMKSITKSNVDKSSTFEYSDVITKIENAAIMGHSSISIQLRDGVNYVEYSDDVHKKVVAMLRNDGFKVSTNVESAYFRIYVEW
ncbi:hypothetical protein MM5_065 [Morganella phage vB_Mm5]